MDPNAKIVFAGMPGYGDWTAWSFLDNVYGVAGIKNYFDVAALQPYSSGLTGVRDQIVLFRASMGSHADGPTPLWVTEFAWGSGPPDASGRNKGLTGQRDLLTQSFNLFLTNRKQWNLQRVYWFLWRDPPAGSPYANLCPVCGTAGLLRTNRTVKPAYSAFRSFTAETTPPVATIVSGPLAGGFTNDPTPTFGFTSNEPGSTFVCRYDATPFAACSSPWTRVAALTQGAHTFYVKAIDAPGNESTVKSRSFTVDTVAPQTTITSGPAEQRRDHRPHPHLRVQLQRGGLDLPVPLRRQRVRRLLGAGRDPHPHHQPHHRQPQLRGPGHRQGQEPRPDAGQAHVHGRSLRVRFHTTPRARGRDTPVREGEYHKCQWTPAQRSETIGPLGPEPTPAPLKIRKNA